jgi:hypothetical protein
LAALSDAVPLERWQRIIEAVVAKAEKGDGRAVALLSGYLLGPPGADRLASLAAAELAGVDPVRDKAADLSRLVNVLSWLDRNTDGQARMSED